MSVSAGRIKRVYWLDVNIDFSKLGVFFPIIEDVTLNRKKGDPKVA